jgi:hypothetical protein
VSDLAAGPAVSGPATVIALTGTRGRGRSVALPLIVMCLSVLGAAACAWGGRDQPLFFVIQILIPAAFTAAGLMLRADVQRRGNAGPCFWAAGFFALGGLTSFDPEGLWIIGWSLGPLVILPVAVLLLRYPGPRIIGRLNRVFIGALVGWMSLWIAESGLQWWRYELYPAVSPSLDDVYTAVARVLIAGAVVLAVALVVLMGHRLARTSGVNRRELIPVAVATLAIAVTSALQIWVVFDEQQSPYIPLLQSLTLLGLAVSLLVAAVQHRFARARVADLVVQVPTIGPTPDIQNTLRRALGDPHLEVLFWAAQTGSYLDSHGATRSTHDDGDRLRVPVVDIDEDPIALILADPSLENQLDLVDAAVGAAGPALQDAREQAVVLAQVPRRAPPGHDPAPTNRNPQPTAPPPSPPS